MLPARAAARQRPPIPLSVAWRMARLPLGSAGVAPSGVPSRSPWRRSTRLFLRLQLHFLLWVAPLLRVQSLVSHRQQGKDRFQGSRRSTMGVGNCSLAVNLQPNCLSNLHQCTLPPEQRPLSPQPVEVVKVIEGDNSHNLVLIGKSANCFRHLYDREMNHADELLTMVKTGTLENNYSNAVSEDNKALQSLREQGFSDEQLAGDC